MLDIDKELEEFNRLLDEVDDEVASPVDDPLPRDTDPVSEESLASDTAGAAESDEHGVESAEYEFESADYDVPSADYDSESGDYDSESGDYDSESGEYDPESGEYDPESGEYDFDAGEYNFESGEYDSETDEYDVEAGDYDFASDEYDSDEVENYQDIAAHVAEDAVEEEEEEAFTSNADYASGVDAVSDIVREIYNGQQGANGRLDTASVDESLDGSSDHDNEHLSHAAFYELTGSEEKPWNITEHIGPAREEEPDAPDTEVPEESANESWVEKPETAAREERPPRVSPVSKSGRGRFPNLGMPDSGKTNRGIDPQAVDSLLRGARGALTGSHHLGTRISPALQVTLPDDIPADEEVPDTIAGRIAAAVNTRIRPVINTRIRPVIDAKVRPVINARVLRLLTSKAGHFEERLGVVVGAVAALVILVIGAVFVPRMFSSDDPDALASVLTATEDDMLLASGEFAGSGQSALSISTFPPGARVYLNSELIGVTPFRDVKVESGLYQVTIEKTDFDAIDTVFTLDSAQDYFFDLSRDDMAITQEGFEMTEHQLLQVTQEASREAVAPPSRPTEEPVRQRNRSSEERASSAVSERSSRRSTPEPRTDSRPQRRTASAPATGSLIVTSDPLGASVFINGQVVGETPATLPEITTGRVNLMLEKEGYVPYETDIMIASSIRTPFHAALAAVKASLFINASPGGDLYVDGELVRRGITPGHMELVPVGTHDVKVVNPDYGEYTERVTVTLDNKASISVDMATHGYQWSIANGDRLFNESRYQEAIDNYNRALALRPGNANLENKIGLAAKAMAESAMPAADSRGVPADGVYAVTDTPPELIGGLEALHANIMYPEEAYREGIQGRVYVQFIVDEDGKPQDITIARGLKGGCNEAAIRAVKKSRFKPATLGGVPVRSRHTLFVNFTL